MPAPILPVSGMTLPEPIRHVGETRTGGTFQDAFAAAVQQVEATTQTASTSAQSFLSGENEELHSTVLATQKAELAFEMFLQVRNKVVSAYQEVMRMQM